MTTTYLINLLPMSVLNNKSQFEVLYGHSPSIKHLKVFECICFAKDLTNVDKMAAKGIACILIGYAANQKGYKLYNLQTGVILVSMLFFTKTSSHIRIT